VDEDPGGAALLAEAVFSDEVLWVGVEGPKLGQEGELVPSEALPAGAGQAQEVSASDEI